MKEQLDKPWYTITDTRSVYSPTLLLYPDRIKENIQCLIQMAGGVKRLRPHIKTCKSAQVIQLMQEAGIFKFKCATIAEAELLSSCQAKDILLAYQPVGPNIERFITLIKRFPDIQFACLVDHIDLAKHLDQAAKEADIQISVYVDLNVGMDRTGVNPGAASILCQACVNLPHLCLVGLHIYDGHIHDTLLTEREKKYKFYYQEIKKLHQQLTMAFTRPLNIVAGGTPTFPFHVQHEEVECSPGTFIFWDWGYQMHFKEQPFLPAALVLSRVISIVDEQKICLDLGYKAISSENSLTQRVLFLNAPEATPVSQSEEHLVLKVADSAKYELGDLFYGLPYHICPTVALYDSAQVIVDHKVKDQWEISARKRFLQS